ncbi:HAD family hydrolase [Telmatospirillum siberiense]|uniref:HAD-IB family hydrolase n=1 Tax=Telmatospirillum siberiense TaxID=382514 RepID=A0A2N3PS61_9PROT|nr:HAD family hydrolase [Telmatospirillum siberiense]PKU23238.1 hypothetical protein CWS72_17590 [Telmatospirillum siberiense]
MPEAVVFDLDGTVLKVNSFRLWVSYLIKARIPHLRRRGRWRLSLGVARALMARKAGVISHETLKWRLQQLWQGVAEGDGGAIEADFVGVLKRFVRPELSDVMRAVAAGEIDAILATAAAGDYAYGLGCALGFRHIVATPRIREKGDPSTVGIFKREAVCRLLAELGWQERDIVLLTDHADDLPLIGISRDVYWFGPEEARTALQRDLPDVRLRPGLQADEILLTQSA